MAKTINARFPEKLEALFQPARYKVVYGGRGGGKSWGIARALLLQGAARPLRILCTREVQRSIRDSVHRLLSDQISALELEGFYEITQTEIRGKNGTMFLFAGLADQTADSVKSYEGVDIVWVEEGQALSDRSWTILIPTIRKDGSEIWVSFNPELDSDPTWVRFREKPPPGAVIIKLNYSDNPWFPDVLEVERNHAERTLPEWEYAHIWEGKCLPAISGAIYAREVADAIEAGRITDVPPDPDLKTHAIFDLGWNDSTAIILAQRKLSTLRIVDYIEDDHRTLDWYSGEMRDRRYHWGQVWLPHDAAAKNVVSGSSPEEVMKRLGWDVRIIPGVSREEGIRTARRGFSQTWIDQHRCAPLINALRRYRRAIPRTTGEPGQPVHDNASHGADAFRYLHLVAPQMENDKPTVNIKLSDLVGQY